MHLAGQKTFLNENNDQFRSELLANISDRFQDSNVNTSSKPFLQLLTMTMSALHILGENDSEVIRQIVLKLLPLDVADTLKVHGCLHGLAQSGNMAMFYAILLIYSRDYLHLDTTGQIKTWVDAHILNQNRFGFWGSTKGMTHLNFQNGYHQYEIFDYLNIHNPKETEAILNTASLADQGGHFAPYPGGGGCFDYDAVAILTPNGHFYDEMTAKLLVKTANTILSEQTDSGGWAETNQLYPRTIPNLQGMLRQLLNAIPNRSLLYERFRSLLAVNRPKNNRIHTHWSKYSREWNEPDLWDSWFRMLSIARIQVATDESTSKEWGFIEFPGLGYNSILRST